MNFLKVISGTAMLILLFSRCIEEFEPPSQDYGNFLVVEAFINKGNEQSDVRLSRSVPLDTSAWIPESGARVSIREDTGEEHFLSETAAGIYQFPEGFNGQSGISYQISIITSGSRQYESDFVTLRQTPDIDSVHWEYLEKPELGVEGLQIYLSTHDPENNTAYYRWYYDETWIFRTPYDATLIYENGQIRQRLENINTCWKNVSSTSIFLGNSTRLDQDVIDSYPLVYVDNTTERLADRYSINVKQYALSEVAYTYWDELKDLNENLGTLFDPMPFSITGNIHNVNDRNETVLGFFDAAEDKEKRIFISHLEIPAMNIFNPYTACNDTLVSYSSVGVMISRGGYMLATVVGLSDYLLSTPTCIDCRYAGTNIRPDFW
ncbi:MAG: DUF4249 domain-containing protein [Cyclobacteriaceae bacterium]|nr:DUF4249 domain-containing protein [Cyclobacteriaceae bacterium]